MKPFIKIVIVVAAVLLTPFIYHHALADSSCFGTTSNGRLENGIKLPSEGKNFKVYSLLGVITGRTYVHTRVQNVILSSFKDLAKSHPGKIFMYGETGFKSGGKFKPHRTHQNGLSVDFMVPVMKEGKSAFLPINIFNKFGYSIEFDEKGTYKNYQIDFEALGAHLVALHKASLKNNINIWRVIFDPTLQPFLFNTSSGSYLKKNIQFSKKRSWVRHDEHYHVDFKIKCGQL